MTRIFNGKCEIALPASGAPQSVTVSMVIGSLGSPPVDIAAESGREMEVRVCRGVSPCGEGWG